MEDLYITAACTTAASTNNNVDESPPRKNKWIGGGIGGGLTILQETAEDNGGEGGKPPVFSPPPQQPAAADEKRGRHRRKSWQMGYRLDKKRRKSVSVLSPIPDAEQLDSMDTNYYKSSKRHSWWNIFLSPENWPRSRRNSDFGATSDERIPYKRGKSRSVDHGLSSPFDLDSLRSKVEGRFESVDKLNKDSGTDGESQSGSKEQLSDRKMPKPPIATITYKVEASDTLTSVAARFDTTPSELAILNRLSSRTLFPGQILRVPDKKRVSVSESDASQGGLSNLDLSETNSVTSVDGESRPGSGPSTGNDNKDVIDKREDDMLDTLRPSSPKPGHPERVGSSVSPSTGRSHSRGVERFLKINVRHITDGQGVVSGVLLVTPNAVMFDPNVSDPLVIEHGPESYGVIAPMEFVVNAAIYYDIAHMRVAGPYQSTGTDNENVTKPAIYHLSPAPKSETIEDNEHKSPTMLTTMQTDSLDSATLDLQISPGGRTDSLLAKDETFPELRSSTEDEEEDGSICSCNAQRNDGAAFPKAFDRDLVTPSPMNRYNESLKRTDKESVIENSGNEDDRPLSSMSAEQDAVCSIRNMEQRRQSSIDQHWAMPNKVRSLDDEPPVHHAVQAVEDSEPSSGYLVKQSCHDSGIDIRDPPVLSVPRKTVYSDADILLSESEFLPPVPVMPMSSDHLNDGVQLRKKKTTSVSFSLEDSKDQDTSGTTDVQKVDDQAEKQAQETKKNKMLKRLSYPLSWMEGFTGDKDSEKEASVPSSAESSHLSHSSSVFSKVFSSSPINMVTDFGSGLFLMKTPSEESGRFQFPPPQDCSPAPPSATPSKREGLASFSPSSIINSVGRSSVTTFMRQQHSSSNSRSDSQSSSKTIPPKLDYRSMVSVDDMPELFASFDKLIPRPVLTFEEPPPLYLRLRMGKPKDKKIPKSTPIMSYGKKKMKPEYWFSVPRDRVDDLYRFLMLWVPLLYGDLDEEVVTCRGFELVESDTELWEEAETPPGDASDKKLERSESEAGDLTRESWEVLSMSDELRRAFYETNVNSLDFESYIPDLHGVTEILTEEHRKQLSRHLPARAEGYIWTLVFSTLQHGFSLNSMYRKMSKVESPILLVIQDTHNNVFGALTSCALKMSDHFYGTGESLLYTFCPEFQVYGWTGDNMYFIKGNNESLSIGAGDGKFGIWLDGDLNQGRTEACNTYGNEALVSEQDFVVKILECWAFL